MLARCIAGSPSRRPGNFGETFGFLLRGQKTTKLRRSQSHQRRGPEPHTGFTAPAAARENNRSVSAQTRPASLSLLSLWRAASIAPSRHLTPAARRAHQQHEVSVARATHNDLRRAVFAGRTERSQRWGSPSSPQPTELQPEYLRRHPPLPAGAAPSLACRYCGHEIGKHWRRCYPEEFMQGTRWKEAR